MATKKFNKFEYAGDGYVGHAGLKGLHRQESFETPHGHVFVVAASAGDDELQVELTDIALSRVRYYLENETEDDVSQVTKNALVYTGGYLYQMGEKDPGRKAVQLSCLCVLFHDDKIYCSRVGDACVLIFDGKKMVPLLLPCWPADDPGKKDRRDETSAAYLGLEAQVDPDTTIHPVEPSDGDKLLLATGSVCQFIRSRTVKKILQDPMPAQSKVSRMLRHAGDESDQEATALIMVCFYNLKEKDRAPVSQVSLSGKQRPHEHTRETMAKGKKPRTAKTKYAKNIFLLRSALVVIGFAVVAYMFYDLFLYDPYPPVDVPRPAVIADPDTIIETPDDTVSAGLELPPALPGDVPYTVRGGDTWGRIYTQFGVCSWFIINHPPNTGRFGRNDGLIAGRTLQIPVRYSGDPDLNPYYYREFTMEKVGSSCQHAGRDFLESFEEKILNYQRDSR